MTHRSPWRKSQTPPLSAGLWDTGYPPRSVPSLLPLIKTPAPHQEKQETGFQLHQNKSPAVPCSWQEAAAASAGAAACTNSQPQGCVGQSWVRTVSPKLLLSSPAESWATDWLGATRSLCRCPFGLCPPPGRWISQFLQHGCREQRAQETCLPRMSQRQSPDLARLLSRPPV